jgi:perosamine synthetase
MTTNRTNDRLSQEFSDKIAGYFGAAGCFLLSKGRVALYVGLKAMKLPPGSKVMIPGYTCMVVPSAIQYAGLEPVYVDIDPDTYNIDPDLLESVYTKQVAAVIVQHTYGIPCRMDDILRWAKAKGLPVVEDCCHAFGARIGGKLCGSFGTFAFLSGQWNKPFSTGLGGMLLVYDASLAERVADMIQSQAHQPSAFRDLMLKLQIAAHDLLVTPRTVARVTRWYRLLTRWGIAIGSSSNEELQGILPPRYLSRMARSQVKKGLREIARVEENIRHRTCLTQKYNRELPKIGFKALADKCGDDLPLLRYPVRVANKDEVLRMAETAKVEIGSWFEVPLHPAETRMDQFGYRDGLCPRAELACRQTINLPTNMKTDERAFERTLAFLAKHAKPV